MTPLRIVRVIARLNMGGPARHVVLLDRALAAAGHRTLLAHGSVDAGEASLEDLAAAAGIRSIRIEGLGRRLHPWDDARALAALVKVLFHEQPDVIHTHTSKAGALGRVAALLFNATRPRARRALVVHTFHGHVLDGYFGPMGNRAVRAVERLLARVSDRIVTISASQRRDIVERFHVAPAEKTIVVPLGLDLQPFLNPEPDETLRHALGIPAGAFVVGFMGRFVSIKNLEALVGAFARFAAVRSDAHLLLAGDGPLRQAIESQVQRLRLERQVHFLGWCTDLAAFHGSIDVCALSSLNEGTPVALIESMAAGVPVVSTRVGGVPDVVDDGETGLLVPSGDEAAMATAFSRLADDPALRTRMGAAARVAATSRYAAEALPATIEQLYTTALPERRGVR